MFVATFRKSDRAPAFWQGHHYEKWGLTNATKIQKKVIVFHKKFSPCSSIHCDGSGDGSGHGLEC